MGQNCCGPSADEHETDGVPREEQARESSVNPAGAEAVETKTAKRQAAAPAPAAAAAASSGGGGGGAAAGGAEGLSFDLALSDLETAEQMVHGTAFQGFVAAGNSVPCSNGQLQEYVATNSALGMEEAETELLKAGSKNEEMQVSEEDFLQILRGNACGESAALERFLGLSANGESLDSGECRTGLLLFCSEDFQALVQTMTEARWDRIFDAVMSDAGATVSMEGWRDYCQRVSRMVRIVHLAKL